MTLKSNENLQLRTEHPENYKKTNVKNWNIFCMIYGK